MNENKQYCEECGRLAALVTWEQNRDDYDWSPWWWCEKHAPAGAMPPDTPEPPPVALRGTEEDWREEVRRQDARVDAASKRASDARREEDAARYLSYKVRDGLQKFLEQQRGAAR